jgi:hypothetical protein
LQLRIKTGILLIVLGFLAGDIAAQTASPLQPGDPPAAALISISTPDEAGMVTITGAAGAVFPAAQVAIRNLYTGEVVYTGAGITGSFNARLYAPGSTPFWISPAESIPAALRGRPGSLPGGPGTIVTSAPTDPGPPAAPVTQIVIDGDLSDWRAYPQAELSAGVFALMNNESLYIAAVEHVPAGSQFVVVLTMDAVTYELAITPAVPQAALLRQLSPVQREPITLAVTSAENFDPESGTVELRVTLRSIAPTAETARLEQVFVRSVAETSNIHTVQQPIPRFDEIDGVVGRMTGDFTRFSVSGTLAGGASNWWATGRASTLDLMPGETVTIEMDVTLDVPDLAASLVGLSLIGEVGLQPMAISADGGRGANQNIAALHSNNGWSNLLTPTGLAIDNLRGDFTLETVTIPAAQVLRRGGQLVSGFRFSPRIPADLPPGLYVPVFQGRAQIGDGEVFAWEESGVFGQSANDLREPFTRLPLVLNMGGVESARLLFTLLHDHPSDGSRGILPDEDSGHAALSNRVRFNSTSYILPPGTYPLEPYLLNQQPNAYDLTGAPLLPLLFPGGRLQATITRPDGFIEELPGAPIVQNRLSTSALDERDRFGAQSPLNAYRLTTLNPAYTRYPFERYGEHQIRLTGTVEDIFGNRYTGGGTYQVVIAEPLDLSPGVLPGTPFHVGDALFAGGRVSPGVPADVTVHIVHHALEGGRIAERTYEMTADTHGYFAPGGEVLVFDVPGEYVIDYEARYTDAQGRLWAASLRSAGVVASADSGLIARGQRGVYGRDTFGTRSDDYRPAWFTTAQFPPDMTAAARRSLMPYYPYHSGDVAFVPARRESGLRPALNIHDRDGAYQDWLMGTMPGYISAGGISLDWLAALDELPLTPVLGGPRTTYGTALMPGLIVNNAYAYISAVRPDVTVRQFVLGSDDDALALHWDADDPYNGQIGAGVGGDRPGDYMFLFGGTVVHNPEAGVRHAAAYASLAVVVNADSPAGVYPPYGGAAGGADSGPLLTVRGEEIDVFFHPTGARPGQVMPVGTPLVIAGQVAPTLQSEVLVEITSPGGERRMFSGLSSPTGYFYDPANDFTVDEIGVWSVRISATPTGVSSAGMPEPPLPVSGVLGTADRTFLVFVVPEDGEPLEPGSDRDTSFRPGAAFNFALPVPAGWTDVQLYHSVTTPSYVLESGPLRLVGSTISYQFSPVGLGTQFPNLEFEGRGTGPAASDVVTFTFGATGIDAEGEFSIRTRTFTLFHDRLMTFEDFNGE